MTAPDSVISSLKRVIDEQGNVIFELKESIQEARAVAEYWQSECEAFESECKAQAQYRHMCLHIPWAVFDQVIHALEHGDSAHALKILNREARS